MTWTESAVQGTQPLRQPCVLAVGLGLSVVVALTFDEIRLALPIAAVVVALVYAWGVFDARRQFRRPGGSPAVHPAAALPGAVEADHFIAREFAAAERGRQVTLVMFGFQRFEEFARTHGTRQADAALREFGDLLLRMTRRMNLTARYGWRVDAFLSVLSDADATAAEAYVARVRAHAQDLAGPLPAIDVGIVTWDASIKSPEAFVEAAERALAAVRAAAYNRPPSRPAS